MDLAAVEPFLAKYVAWSTGELMGWQGGCGAGTGAPLFAQPELWLCNLIVRRFIFS